MEVAKLVARRNLIPAKITLDGKVHRAKLLAFTVLDYGYHFPLRKPDPGIPLHQVRV